MKKRLIAVLTLLIILLSFNFESFAEDITGLINEQNELQQKKSEADSRLEIVQEELSENVRQLEEINSRIAEYENEITDWGAQIDDLNASMQEVQQKLNVAQRDYDKQEELLGNRLVTLYEAGDTTFLDFMLNSSNIVDFISNYYLISELTEYDSELLDNIESQNNTIEQNKKMLEEQQNQYNIVKANYEKKKIILYNTKILKDSYTAKLSEEENNLASQIDEYRNQILAVEAEISKITTANIDSQYIGGEMAWPVPGYTRITSTYGMRTHPITGVYKLHSGVDIGAPTGANFIAANDGVVTKAGFNTAYGNMVIIDHGGGISTLYAHGSEIVVHEGQAVKKGDTILKVGSTGYATGPHAHFEVRVNGEPTNPLTYITSSINVEQTDNN